MAMVSINEVANDRLNDLVKKRIEEGSPINNKGTILAQLILELHKKEFTKKEIKK